MTKAARQTTKVMTVKMNWIKRYRSEWLGAWKCEATASTNMIRVSRAATG